MASVFCIGRATWSSPATAPATVGPAGSGDIVEAVQRGAVERGDLAPILVGEHAQRLLDGALRLGEGAVGVRVVRGPHAGIRPEVRYVLVGQRLFLERGDDLSLEELARRHAR